MVSRPLASDAKPGQAARLGSAQRLGLLLSLEDLAVPAARVVGFLRMSDPAKIST